MLVVGSGWRAYFAPFDYQARLTSPLTGGPRILDLEYYGPFNTSPNAFGAPTQGQLASANSSIGVIPGWIDCGWIKEFKRTPQSKIGQVRSGYRGAVRVQYRGQVGEQFQFKFREHGRLQYKLSSGVTLFNILQTSAASGGIVGPLNSAGSPTPAVAIGASGYVASGNVAGYVGSPTLYVPSGSGAAFPVNNYIVADVDFVNGQSGVIGENGTFAFPNAVTDVDYIRKTSDFVCRVTAVVPGVGSPVQDALILDQPFIGGGSPAATTTGTPPSTSKVQNVKGWAAREGGTFIQEWSGLFVADTIDGAQIAMYYPHVSIMQNNGFADWQIENIGTTDLMGTDLDAVYTTLAFDDPEDGETVTSYSMFYPNARVQNTY